MNAVLNLRVSEAVAIIGLVALAFPTLLLIQLGGRYIYPHYPALLLAITVLLMLRPVDVMTIRLSWVLLVLSSLLNLGSLSLTVVIFHVLHLMAIALLSGSALGHVLRFAKITLMAYVAAIVLAKALETVGLGELVAGLLISDPDQVGEARVAAFATEPSYAGLIMLILGRFIILHDAAWMTLRRIGLVLATMLLTLSLFSLLAAFLLLLVYLRQQSSTRVILGMLLGGLVLGIGIGSTDFFAMRAAGFDTSLGLMGFGTGTIRLLPYIYLAEIIPENPMALIVGGGGGAFQPQFFADLGQYYTNNATLTGQMAAGIYDYGLPVVVTFLMWNRPPALADKVLYLAMALMVILNSGIGTYLFIIFGVFSLLEQRIRDNDKSFS